MSSSIKLIQFVSFLDLLAVGLIIPLIPSHVRQLGASHISIGLLGSIYAGFQLLSGPIVGTLSDIKGRRVILILTLLTCGVTYAALGLSTSIVFILLLRGILGIFKHTQLLSRALVPDYEKNETKQSHVYGKMAAISSIGFTLGPIIGGHVIEDFPQYGFTIIALTVCFCFFVNAGVVYILPKVDSTTHSKKYKNILDLTLSSCKQIVLELSKVTWSKYWIIFLFKALTSFAMGIYYSSYSLYLKTEFELSPKNIGYVVAVNGVIGAVASFLMGYINKFYNHDKDYTIRNHHVFLTLSLSLFGMTLSHNMFMYIIFIIPLSIANAVARLVTLEMLLKKSEGDHRGTLIGAANSVRSMTGIVTPIISGSISQFFGVKYIIYGSLTSTLLGLIISYTHKVKQIKRD